MRFIKNIGSGFLIGLGVMFLLAGLSAPLDPKTSNQEKHDAFWGCMLLGVPITAWGIWIRRGLNAEKPKEGDRLRTLFFNLLQASAGQITVLRFAMESGLSGDQAKAFLDERAKEFNATFEVDEAGGVIYCFNLGPALSSPPTPVRANALETAGPAYNVILEEVPARIKINAIKLVREVNGLGLKDAKDLVEQVPQAVRRGVTWETAESLRHRFEAAGLRVRIEQT